MDYFPHKNIRSMRTRTLSVFGDGIVPELQTYIWYSNFCFEYHKIKFKQISRLGALSVDTKRISSFSGHVPPCLPVFGHTRVLTFFLKYKIIYWSRIIIIEPKRSVQTAALKVNLDGVSTTGE